MADVSNTWSKSSLPVGALVSCTLTHGDVLRGNVIATDEANQAVVIRSISPSSFSATSRSLTSGDVHIINLRHVSDLSVTSQPQQNGIAADPSALPHINVAKVDQRIKKNLTFRWREINSRGVNVTEEAQQLFDALRKLYDEIIWDKDVIVVMNDVRVPPPYSPDSCTGSSSLTNMIKKQVTKFFDDKNKQP